MKKLTVVLLGVMLAAVLVLAGCGTGQAVQAAKVTAKESVMDLFLSAGQTKSGTELCASANKKCSLTLVSQWSETPVGYFSRLVLCTEKITAPATVSGQASPYVRISASCN